MTALDISINLKDYTQQKLNELYSKLVYYLKFPIGPEKPEYVAIYRDYNLITQATRQTLFKNHNVKKFVEKVKKLAPPSCLLYIRVLNREEIVEKVGNYSVTFKLYDSKANKVIEETNKTCPLPSTWTKCDVYELKIPKQDPSDLKLLVDVTWEAKADKVQLRTKSIEKANNSIRQELQLNNLEVDRNVSILLVKYIMTEKTMKSISQIPPRTVSDKSVIKKGFLRLPNAMEQEIKPKKRQTLVSRIKQRLFAPRAAKFEIETLSRSRSGENEDKYDWVSLNCFLQLGAQKPYAKISERIASFRNQIDLYILLANQGRKIHEDIQALTAESKWINLYDTDSIYILNQARLHSTMTETEDDFCRVVALMKIYTRYARTKNLTYLVDAFEKLHFGIKLTSSTCIWPQEINIILEKELNVIVEDIFDADMPAALLCEVVYPYNNYGALLFKAQMDFLENVTKLNSGYAQYRGKVAKGCLKAAKKWLNSWENEYKFDRPNITQIIEFLRAIRLFIVAVIGFHKGIALPRPSQRSLRELHLYLDQIISTRVAIPIRTCLKQLQHKLPVDYTSASEIAKRNAIFQAMPYKDAYNCLRVVVEEFHSIYEEPPELRITLISIQRWFPLNVTQAWVASEIKKIERECAEYEKDITKLNAKQLFEHTSTMYGNLLGFVSWSHPIFPARTAKDIVYCLDLVAVVYKTWYQKLKPSERESNYEMLSEIFNTFIDVIKNVAETLTKNVNTDPDLRSSVVDWITTQAKSWRGVLRAFKWRYEKPKGALAPKLNILTVGDKRLFRLRMLSRSRRVKKTQK